MSDELADDSIARHVLASQEWSHRRVETLRMDDEGRTRLHVSLDLTVPHGPSGSTGSVLVPLSFIEKGTLTSLSTRGPAGDPLPVLGAQDNSRWSVAALTDLALRVMPHDLARSAALAQKLTQIVQGDRAGARHWFLRYLVWRREVALPDTAGLDLFDDLVRVLHHQFLLLVELDRGLVGRRVVVKYSHDVPEPIPAGRSARLPSTFAHVSGQFGWARSWHLEVHAPPGTAISRLAARETGASVEAREGGEQPAPSSNAPHGETRLGSGGTPMTLAHVAMRPSGRLAEASVRFTLVPNRPGLRGTSLWGAWITLGVLAVAAAHRWTGLALLASPLVNSAPVSILLTGPALFLSWVSRSPEHPITARLLRPVRSALATSAGALLALALLIAAPLTATASDAVLFAACVLQTATTARVSMLWFRVASGGYDRSERRDSR